MEMIRESSYHYYIRNARKYGKVFKVNIWGSISTRFCVYLSLVSACDVLECTGMVWSDPSDCGIRPRAGPRDQSAESKPTRTSGSSHSDVTKGAYFRRRGNSADEEVCCHQKESHEFEKAVYMPCMHACKRNCGDLCISLGTVEVIV